MELEIGMVAGAAAGAVAGMFVATVRWAGEARREFWRGYRDGRAAGLAACRPRETEGDWYAWERWRRERAAPEAAAAADGGEGAGA